MRARPTMADEIAAFKASPIPGPKKPRAKSSRPEDVFHASVKKFLTLVIGPAGVCSNFGVIWYSVETRAKRSVFEGARNKGRGCISGCPDIDIYAMGSAYKIELKAPKGVISFAQDALHKELARAQIPVLVARDLESISKVLDTWCIPHKRASF